MTSINKKKVGLIAVLAIFMVFSFATLGSHKVNAASEKEVNLNERRNLPVGYLAEELLFQI